MEKPSLGYNSLRDGAKPAAPLPRCLKASNIGSAGDVKQDKQSTETGTSYGGINQNLTGANFHP